jgi:hypothetical protein
LSSKAQQDQPTAPLLNYPTIEHARHENHETSRKPARILSENPSKDIFGACATTIQFSVLPFFLPVGSPETLFLLL